MRRMTVVAALIAGMAMAGCASHRATGPVAAQSTDLDAYAACMRRAAFSSRTGPYSDVTNPNGQAMEYEAQAQRCLLQSTTSAR